VADHISPLLRTATPAPNKAVVSITSSLDATTPKGRAVVGTVVNSGPEITDYKELVADFFDSEGHLVDTCTDGVRAGLQPSATTSFKIACGDPDAPKLHPHVSFKVRTEVVGEEGGP
jgi:hypothetical protein